MALCTAMTVCLYCVTFADFSFCMKICFGIAALLYMLMVFVPCCIRKREKKGLPMYASVLEFIDETVAKD